MIHVAESADTPSDHVRSSRPRRGSRRAMLLALTGTLLAGSLASAGASRPLKSTPPPYVPPSLHTVIKPALNLEGHWIRRDAWHKGPQAIMTTYFRPFASSPSVVAYAGWIRSSAVRVGLYLGYQGPGPVNAARGPEEVPQSGRDNLLAAFNSGFYEKDSLEGFFTHNVQYYPMIDGKATLIEYSSGKMDIINWTGGSHVPSNVVMARQNLQLMVNHSVVTPPVTSLNIETGWGITLGGVPAVWRSGVGVDAKGNLIYVAASDVTPLMFAQILVKVGCVRAMELDINPEWPIFTSYGAPNALQPQLDVANPNQIADRFLYTSTKDFFAVYLRTKGTDQTPW